MFGGAGVNRVGLMDTDIWNGTKWCIDTLIC
jgi:hypothetical protein